MRGDTILGAGGGIGCHKGCTHFAEEDAEAVGECNLSRRWQNWTHSQAAWPSCRCPPACPESPCPRSLFLPQPALCSPPAPPSPEPSSSLASSGMPAPPTPRPTLVPLMLTASACLRPIGCASPTQDLTAYRCHSCAPCPLLCQVPPPHPRATAGPSDLPGGWEGHSQAVTLPSSLSLINAPKTRI